MMRDQILLQYLGEVCDSINDPRLPETAIVYYPNEPVPDDADGAALYYEVNVGNSQPVAETESASLAAVVGSIVISGALNVGSSLVDAVAGAIVDRFAPRTARGRRGFVYEDPDGVRSDVYVAEVERSASDVYAGRFKVTVFLTFHIYED